MDKCPKCGKKLSLFYVKQECSDCGCDLLNFEREKNLEADAQQAEEEFAQLDELLSKLKGKLEGLLSKFRRNKTE